MYSTVQGLIIQYNTIQYNTIQLYRSGVGGSMNGTFVYYMYMLYANDISIISLSSSGLQRLLNICDDYCKLHDLIFNVKKSMCIYFSTAMNKHCGCPVIYLRNSVRQYVQKVKYLWVFLYSTMKTTLDVARQTRKFYLQANLLLHNFKHCSDDVKCALFQTCCTNMYCCQLWFNSTKCSIKSYLHVQATIVFYVVFFASLNHIAQVICLHQEEFPHLLNFYGSLYIDSQIELRAVQILLLVLAYHLLGLLNGGVLYCM